MDKVKNTDDAPKFIYKEDVIKMLGISDRTYFTYLKNGMPHYAPKLKNGQRVAKVYFIREEILDWMRGK